VRHDDIEYRCVYELLANWLALCKEKVIDYERGMDWARRKENVMIVPLAIMGALATSGVFITIDQKNSYAQLATGFISLMVTVGNAIHAKLNYKTILSDYRASWGKYRQLAISIEVMLGERKSSKKPLTKVFVEVDRLKRLFESLSQERPVPSHIHAMARAN